MRDHSILSLDLLSSNDQAIPANLLKVLLAITNNII